MSTNRYLQMATAGADVTVPEEINPCCFFSCQVCTPRSGNVVAIPNTCDFVVAVKQSNGDTRVDHWTQDPTTGNLTRNNNCRCLYSGGTFGESIHNAGGLTSAPYNAVDLAYHYGSNCGYRLTSWCLCGSCLCANSDTLGEALNNCCSCFEGPNGINQLCYQSNQDSYILFHGGTGCIHDHAFGWSGGSKYSPCGGESGRKTVATNWCKSTNKAVGLHYDNNTCKFHLTFTPSGSNNWGHWTIQHTGGADFFCCCNYFGSRGICYEGPSLKGGYDGKRCVNVWAASHKMYDENSNFDIGLYLVDAPSCTGCATGLGTVTATNYCDADLAGYNNSVSMLQGFMEHHCGDPDQGGSHNLIVSHGVYNGSFETTKVHQIVYGSGGYQETLCLFHTQGCVRPLCGTNGAYNHTTGWSVMAFSAYCNNCYFLRAFKGRCVS